MPRIVRLHELGAADVLTLEDVPMPQPGPGEVRLGVDALGLHPEAKARAVWYIYEAL